MKVHIPSQLHSYTGKVKFVEAGGATLDGVLRDLDRRYPGLRFRIINEQDRVRDHIRIFVNGEQTFDITMPLQPKDEVQIVGALSGG
jgi:molybdopterin converting factor small subunit